MSNIQPELIFKGANLVAGGLLVAGAVGNFIFHSFSSIIIGIYALVFGAITLALELVPIPSPYTTLINRYASFFYSFAGRGVFYVLAGVLLLNNYTLLYISGSIIAFIGVAFFALEFVPMFDPPASMVAPRTSTGFGSEESQPVWSADGGDV